MARVILFLIWTPSLCIFAAVVKLVGLNSAPIRVLYYRGVCRLFGINVIVHGQVTQDRPLLIASNHISYLDIIVFGAITELEFVSKAEVANWPVIGILAKMADTVFVERRRSKTGKARDGMSKRLAAGRRLVFFPEATSGDGTHMLPFKSALFTVAETAEGIPPLTVQPAALAYTRLNGLPTGTGWRPFFAWYGDMTLTSHAWRFLQLGHTTVEVKFQEPVQTSKSGDSPLDRKALAAEVEQSVRAGFMDLLSGRTRP